MDSIMGAPMDSSRRGMGTMPILLGLGVGCSIMTS